MINHRWIRYIYYRWKDLVQYIYYWYLKRINKYEELSYPKWMDMPKYGDTLTIHGMKYKILERIIARSGISSTMTTFRVKKIKEKTS